VGAFGVAADEVCVEALPYLAHRGADAIFSEEIGSAGL
jgi:hypothetical protein